MDEASHRFFFLFQLLLLSVVTAVPFPVPTCSLTFCALNGALELCAAADPTCAHETCSPLPAGPCGLWEARCAHACPSVCLPEEHRPVASDGIAYCTDCSFVHASCVSRFSIMGPVARGVEHATGVENPSTIHSSSPSPSPSPTSSGRVEWGGSVYTLPSITPVWSTAPIEPGEDDLGDDDALVSPGPTYEETLMAVVMDETR